MIWSRRRSGRAADDPVTAAPPKVWAGPAGRLVRAAAVAILVAVAVAWWARNDGADPAAGSSPPPVAAAGPPATAQDLGQLAAAVGCQAQLTGQNSGYRQAVCVTPSARYTLTTFSTDKGQQEWLSEAVPYGGAYLVGIRWVVNAQTSDGLPALAAKLGGRIVDRTEEHHS
jgi:hypothetical protein